jgi:hypothetical protein
VCRSGRATVVARVVVGVSRRSLNRLATIAVNQSCRWSGTNRAAGPARSTHGGAARNNARPVRYVIDFTKRPRNEFFRRAGRSAGSRERLLPTRLLPGYPVSRLFNNASMQSVTKLVALIVLVPARTRPVRFGEVTNDRDGL